MSISTDQLTTDIVVVDDTCRVQYAADYIGPHHHIPLVVQRSDGRYAVFFLAHLLDMLQQKVGSPFTSEVLWSELNAYEDFLDRLTAETVEITSEITLIKANKLATLQPLGMVVALDENYPVGLVDPLSDTRSESNLPAVDYALIPPAEEAMIGEEESGGLLPEPELTPKPSETGAGPGTLSADTTVEPRLVNLELLDSSFTQHDPTEKPLKVKDEYYLTVFIDNKLREGAISGGTVSAAHFDDQQEHLTATVRLESADFDIDVREQQLVIPRKGKSKELNFMITPLKDGPGIINIVFLKDGAFLQVNTITLYVGELPNAAVPPIEIEKMGLDMAQAAGVQPRDVNITIVDAVGGFQLILSGSVTAFGHLPFTKAALHAMIAQVRQQLKDIVFFAPTGERVYQTRIDIPAGISKQTLPILANAGYDLFHKLFIYNMDETTKRMGEALKELAKSTKLKLQIVSKDFTMPWGLLYVGDNPDEPEPEMFLGLKHVIEHIPLQFNMQVLDPHVNSSDGFTIALNVNKDIDTQMGQPIIGRQIEFWEKLAAKTAAIQMDVRENIPQVMKKMNDGETQDDLIYFYCHALSFDISETASGGPDNSKLVLTGHQELTLSRMQRADNPFPGHPLVFINACESAELSPQFYHGFVPYFMSKGARGVIGTEVETPALFAEEFAYRFFKRFLAADSSLGELFLDLRRKFFFEQNNVMGLLYALYVDGDTRVTAPVIDD